MAVRMLKAQTGRLNYKLQRNISAHNLSVYYLKKIILFLKIFSVRVSDKILTAPEEVNNRGKYQKYIKKEQLHLGWSEKPKDILI